MWFGLLCALVFGGVFGSFANVVIWRFPRGESLSTPGSHCPSCDSPIRWYDNIPVISWMALRGACRDCRVRISPRYPMVEAASAFLWGAAFLRFGFTWRALFAAAFFYMLLILSFIDLDTKRLPNPLVAVLAGIGAAGAVASAALGVPAVPLIGSGNPLVLAVGGAVLSAGPALAIALVYAGIRKREGFGMGDVKLLGAIGLYLGPFGPMVLFFASVLGAVIGVWQGSRSGEGMTASIPFGPFLASAAVIVTFVGPAVWTWYWGLIR
jgi:leader peptidase (prepilin peptidase)/N-methyltransferase